MLKYRLIQNKESNNTHLYILIIFRSYPQYPKENFFKIFEKEFEGDFEISNSLQTGMYFAKTELSV